MLDQLQPVPNAEYLPFTNLNKPNLWLVYMFSNDNKIRFSSLEAELEIM